MLTSYIFLIALVITMVIMFLTWAYAVKIENFGIVDAVWSFCFIIHMLIFDLFSEGFSQRQLLLLFMVGFWSLRLGFYLAKRIASHHPQEDTRYIKLRADYGQNYKLRFLLFFFYQAVSVSFLTFPSFTVKTYFSLICSCSMVCSTTTPSFIIAVSRINTLPS